MSKKKTVIASTIAIMMVSQVSFAQSDRSSTAAALGALFGAVVGAAATSGNQPSQNQNSNLLANVRRESEESVNKLVQALQGRKFKCHTAEAGVISLHFESNLGMILVNGEEKMATTNASLTDGKYRWFSPQYDKEYTAINSGSILTSAIDGKVYRGAAIAVNSGNEITYLKCTRIIENSLFDPLPTDVKTAEATEATEAAPEEGSKKEKGVLSRMWKAAKGK